MPHLPFTLAIASIALLSSNLFAQGTASPESPNEFKSASPNSAEAAASSAIVPPSLTPEQQCSTSLGAAASNEKAANNATLAKHWTESVEVYTKAIEDVKQAIAVCTGDSLDKAADLQTSLEVQLGKAIKTRQKMEVCRPAFDNALALDMKAATAKSNKAPILDVERLFSQALQAWRNAVSGCQGSDKKRAQESLADTAQSHAAIRSISDSGKECDDAWRSAEGFVELGKSAWSEKRWKDAAMLYRKAAMGWDVASEKCETGERHTQTASKKESAEIDSRNATQCAPKWDEAREFGQRLKVESQVLSQSDRSALSMQTEALWRYLAENCEGTPREKARGNADAIARERGTPLTIAIAPAPPKSDKYALSQQEESAATPPDEEEKPAAEPTRVTTPNVPVNSAALSATIATTSAIEAAASGQKAGSATNYPDPAANAAGTPVIQAGMAQLEQISTNVIKVGNTLYEGNFQVDDETRRMTGTGTVKWASGDIFIGNLVKGEQEGKGRYIWKNGQTYEGSWVASKPTGMGSIKFVDGNQYDGNFIQGVPDGRGTLRYASGDIYEGEFRNGVPSGNGRYSWVSGDYYVGEWRAGKQEGQGNFVWADGSKQTGLFKDGAFLANNQ